MKILSRILALTAKPLNKQERLSTQMADVKSASPQKPVEPRMGENLTVTSCRRVASRKEKVQVCGLRMSRHKTAQVSTQEFHSRDKRSGCLLLAKGGKTFCKRRSRPEYNRREGRPFFFFSKRKPSSESSLA